MEKTFVIIKPDAVQRGLIGEVIGRFEKKGLKLVAMKMMKLSDAVLREHYSHIVNKPFFPSVSGFMQSSPVIALAFEGVDAVESVRNMCGITSARKAAPGTIRGDLGMGYQCNVVHTSENTDDAKDELARFFNPEDFFDYDKAEYMHIYSEDELS
ncbi:nucleoside-diphosphate kinase [Candidatus Gracilibacteria bacterium]|nr:nucleoside-diphosphate kinase [Candidatus Gracilibacteria bacterium]